MCEKCGSEGKPIKARKMCSTCYNRFYWKNLASPNTIANRNLKAREYHYIKDTLGYVPKNLRPKQTKEERAARIAIKERERRQYRRELINNIKLKSGCIDCGYNENPVALDFDHLNNKTMGISKALGKGKPLEFVLKEIEKCVVRCANCHRIKTKECDYAYKEQVEKTNSEYNPKYSKVSL
jgi:hypothetical protein